MEREIKFRGKSINQNMWLYGHLFQWGVTKGVLCVCCCVPNSYRDVYNIYAVNPETIGQYTGLKDKNGREIYEGDVLFVKVLRADNYFEYNTDVIFKDGAFLIKGENTNDYDTLLCAYINPTCPLVEMEVISNIHDNPELIK